MPNKSSFMNRAIRYACMPLVSNIPIGHDDWRQVNCPVCGSECWETNLARYVLKNDSATKAACTLCSLKMAIKKE